MLPPHKDHPIRGETKVYVYICKSPWGGEYWGVSSTPVTGSQKLNIGANAEEIQRVVKLLEETQRDLSSDNGA